MRRKSRDEFSRIKRHLYKGEARQGKKILSESRKRKKIICSVTSQTFATDGLKWHLAVIKQSARFRWPEKQATHLSKQS